MRIARFALLALAPIVGLTAPPTVSAQVLERLFVPDVELFDESYTRFGAADGPDHAAWRMFLKNYVATDAAGVNRVAYGRVTPESKRRLEDYIARLEAADPTEMRREEAYAYWVNLYNAATVNLILDEYPVSSIRDIKDGVFSAGPWGRQILNVNGRAMSLGDIEHGVVRAVFDDPRAHYVLNCAAAGCPNLGLEPYEGETLDAALNAAARAYVNDPRGVRVEGGSLVASKIFGWYREDWGGKRAVVDELRRWAAPELKTALADFEKIDDHEYDWSLNDAPSTDVESD